jgi:DNA helicase-2/ATP-dependent DNA helicase PcrA
MEQMGMIKISASSVKTFQQCPRKYKYNYLDHLPKKTFDHLILGNLCHKVLEIFHRQYIQEPIPKTKYGKLMGSAFEEARKEFDTTKKIEDEAFVLLKDYLATLSKSPIPKVKDVEVPFEFNLDDTVIIRGFIDRIDLIGERFRIVDYKTTKNVKYLEPFQLNLYGLWLHKEYPNLKDFDASYVLLRHKSKTKDYTFNLKDLDRIHKELLAYANKIKNEVAWNTNPSPLCRFCDFYEVCDAQNSKGW